MTENEPNQADATAVSPDPEDGPAGMIRDFTRRHGLITPPCLDGCGLIAHGDLTCADAKAQGFVLYQRGPDGYMHTTFVPAAREDEDDG